MMSRERIAIVAATGAFLVMVVLALLDTHRDKEVTSYELKFPTPPPVERVYTPSEATVEVSAYFDDQRAYGKGVIVQHTGQKFVLTSSMILNKDVDWITVVGDREIALVAEVLHQNDIWGLVALECHLANTPFIELNDDAYCALFSKLMIQAVETGDEEVITDYAEKRIDSDFYNLAPCF